MRLTLVTRDGAQIAPAYAGPRFRATGGSLVDFAQQNVRPTLHEAQLALHGYEEMLSDPAWDERVRANLLREARSLREAVVELCAWRRASGYRDPHDADRTRGARA